MRAVLSSLLGVPATVLIAAGGGIVTVTLVSRLRRRRNPPIRWVHLGLGMVILLCGAGLMALDVLLVGVA